MMASGPPVLSLIVPTWGDDERVADLVRRLEVDPDWGEWVVAAVQPTEVLEKLAREGRICLVRCGRPSRGRQMNRGAACARGRIFCFHHADSDLKEEHLLALAAMVEAENVVGGAFHRCFDDRHPAMKRFASIGQWLNVLGGPLFGDQSIFARAEIFRELTGFADIPLMEDVEFSRRLRRVGKVVLLGPPLVSSARRFHRLGRWRTSLLNACFILLFYGGVSPHTLHRWYYSGWRNGGSDARKGMP